mmetsp:Transcript_40603/g.105410  ORF Transcript_40603/g.105410 Transcript_40603/m.105410 type:complete len:83 (-) Transcript_40603:353-601(-)
MDENSSLENSIIDMVESREMPTSWKTFIFALLRVKVEEKAVREKRNKMLRSLRKHVILPFLYGASGGFGICLGRELYARTVS